MAKQTAVGQALKLPMNATKDVVPISARDAIPARTPSGPLFDLLKYVESHLPTQAKTRRVFLGIGVAALSVAGAYATYLLIQHLRGKSDQDKYEELLKLNAELLKARQDSQNRILDSPPEGVIILHQCPRGRRTPSIAPYPLKLETFLRVHGIKYEIDFRSDGPQHPTTPWVRLDLEDVTDSQNCISLVCQRYGLDPDAHVDESMKPIGLAFNHMLENHIYWGIALWRWVYDGARNITDIQFLPPKTMGLLPSVCRTVEQAAWFHGLGKKKPAEVVNSILLDLASLSAFLADKEYFLTKDKPSELDCTAFSLLA